MRQRRREFPRAVAAKRATHRTTLDVVTVLTISIVYRSCAIPVAWHGVGATTPGAWRPHWEPLITILQQAIPPAWTAIVAADRGFYGHWLFQWMTSASQKRGRSL
ncbi:hypothetical protein [Herpetosiphon llansteffanensis]|uniref:hypothetical protein n=1 Tax=Herpetosiphon llansteffanensis TaxID=2094568 RepID=UPI000F51AC4E|nr:hypothetical protein [Herpetosiphon llansteffanensis]